MAYRPLALHPSRQPWDQQPGETARTFERFRVFREEIDHPRTYRSVAERCGLTRSTIEQQAAAHKWQERVSAFDGEQARLRRERVALKASKLADRQMEIALGMAQAVGQAVHYVLQNRIVLEPEVASKWLDIATKVGKIAEGQPERTVAVTGRDGGPIEVSEFQDLTPEQKRVRAQEMAQGVLRLYQGGKSDTPGEGVAS